MIDRSEELSNKGKMELTVAECASILDAALGQVGVGTVRNLIKHGIIKPLICPRNGWASVSPDSLVTAYVAITTRREGGFTLWRDVVPVIGRGERVKQIATGLRKTPEWETLASAAVHFGVNLDIFPILKPDLD